MDPNSNNGGSTASALVMSASRILRGITCSEPRMLTESEIVLLRQSKAEVGQRVRELIIESKAKAASEQG